MWRFAELPVSFCASCVMVFGCVLASCCTSRSRLYSPSYFWYKSLSRATEMMKNSWKKTLKNNPSYFTDPEKQKVLRFAMQRPANYLTEIETYLEKALAEALEEEKTA